MKKNLTIYYTSDVHGCFSPVDYATGKAAAAGLANCMAQFQKDGNTLVIDGGDLLQGSPFTNWLYSERRGGACVPAQLLNAGGYDFITLGNHDFDYGKAEIERFLDTLDARCLCANVEGVRGVEKTAVVTMENGLRVGLTGMITPFVTRFEKPENMAGIRVTDAFGAAWAALGELRRKRVDVTVCIYHGGYEADVKTGAIVSRSGENQGWRMCNELGFDVLLAAHQHMRAENLRVGGTHTCQLADKAREFARVDVAYEGGHVQARSALHPAGERTLPAAEAMLRPLEQELAVWLDTPVGRLDTEIPAQEPLERALNGSLMANLINQVQLAASGAALSAASVSENVGLPRDVTIRNIVSVYPFANTLKTIVVTRRELKAALERSMAYFAMEADGTVTVSEAFLRPVAQHFNYDYISGVHVTADLRRPVGERVTSIRYQGGELDEGRELTLCLNSYRASGAGGYEAYASCRTVREETEEVSELMMRYVRENREIHVDRTRWLDIQQRTDSAGN